MRTVIVGAFGLGSPGYRASAAGESRRPRGSLERAAIADDAASQERVEVGLADADPLADVKRRELPWSIHYLDSSVMPIGLAGVLRPVVRVRSSDTQVGRMEANSASL